MRSIEQSEIIKREISRKIKKLAALEKDQSINDFNSDNDEFKVSRKVYACFDGFIILRTFSKEHIDPFELVISSDRIVMFLKNQLPIKTKNGLLLSFYKLINPVIRLDWKIGMKVDIGSKGGGVKINEFHIDGFQLMIFSYKEMEQIKETLDDIEFIIYSNGEIQKLTEENNELKNTINNLNTINEPLIITEGKTDWKHFISALRHFHSINEFVEIQEKWFLKFGSIDDISNSICDTNFEFENNVSKLNKLLDSYIEARTIDNNISKSVRIGIFDSDDNKAKARIDNENKIYSFLIEPTDISTEFLYSEKEIKSLIEGKRLFIGSEFNEKTKRLKENSSINLGGDNNNLNKTGRNVIVDTDVYNEVGINIALTKEKFAQHVYYKNLNISDESLNNFRHIFRKISGYINK